MNKDLRIAVLDADPASRQFLQNSLPRLGHHVLAVADAAGLAEVCQSHDVELIIADVHESRLDNLLAAEQVFERTPIPVIVVSAQEPPEFLDHVESSCVFGYLVKPIQEAELRPAIMIARSRFNEVRILREEVGSLRQALCDRKLIERAKGLLMRQTGLDEANAFRRLQHLAREKSAKLSQIADMIITAQQAIDGVRV